MAITTSSVLSAPVQQRFNYKLLSVATPYFNHTLFAEHKTKKARTGTTERFRRYNPLTSAPVPLGTSGVNPPAQLLTAIDIDARIDFYGTYVLLNEQVTLQSQDPVLNEAALRLGISLRQTEDELTRDMLAATCSFINCVGGVNGDTPTDISVSDVNSVINVLVNNDAKTISQNITAENKEATAPIRDAYWAMCSAQLITDFDNLAGFISKNNYASDMKSLPSEWGAINNVRFVVSSIGSITTNASNLNADVFNILIAAKESYACIKQDEYTSQFVYIPPQIAGGPLALNASVGWKMAYASRILNDAWIVNLRATRS